MGKTALDVDRQIRFANQERDIAYHRVNHAEYTRLTAVIDALLDERWLLIKTCDTENPALP